MKNIGAPKANYTRQGFSKPIECVKGTTKIDSTRQPRAKRASNDKEICPQAELAFSISGN